MTSRDPLRMHVCYYLRQKVLRSVVFVCWLVGSLVGVGVFVNSRVRSYVR